MITDKYLETIRKVSAGFPGTFVFDPAHAEDRGVGTVADVVEFDDRLMYVPKDSDIRDEDCCEISDQLDENVARAMADLLNAVPALLGEIDRLRAADRARPIGERSLVRIASYRGDHRYEGVIVCRDHLRGLFLDDAPLEEVAASSYERCIMCGVQEVFGRTCESDRCRRPLHPQWPAVYCCNACALEDL